MASIRMYAAISAALASVVSGFAAVLSGIASVGVLMAAEPDVGESQEAQMSEMGSGKVVTQRAIRVELAGRPHPLVKTSWPAIGCWFLVDEEFKPGGYRRFLDLHQRHSAYQLLTTSIRHPVEVTDPKVHDQIKESAAYARTLGMGIVMDLDIRLARQAFQDQYPGAMQEMVRLRDVALARDGEATIAVEPVTFSDHYTFKARPYETIAARVLGVYAYSKDSKDALPRKVEDITARVKIVQAGKNGVKVAIPSAPGDEGRTACVLASFTLFAPDVFSPHVEEFERAILGQYADTQLAGACKDEWGFPGRHDMRAPGTVQVRMDDLYYSQAMADVYAKRRGGRSLTTDLFLMAKGTAGLEGERVAAINHYMEMNWQRNAQIEAAFYRGVKEVFGRDAWVGTHPTWHPNPDSIHETIKNGLDWWAVPRDLAQTDESTPFSVRTALAKKWHSPLWYNMFYASKLRPYEENLWQSVLGGGRINYHPCWPVPIGDEFSTSLLRGDLQRADSRVQMLNHIATAPVDCPVAVVFGHPSAINWAGRGAFDTGMVVANGLWKEGFYADLIPSSEIAAGHLKVGSDGQIEYGPQRYAAVVLYHPEYERVEMSSYFHRAAKAGKTALFRVGQWSTDFDGKPLGAGYALPVEMKAVEAAKCPAEVVALLKAKGHEPQTPGAMWSAGGSASMMPRPRGRCRLLDGTVIAASGQESVLGDPIKTTLRVGRHEAAFDAVGLAAVRFDADGKVAAMAAGGLKSFRAGDLTIELERRADVALWRDDQGKMRGVLQDHAGELPASLAAVTRDWIRLSVPTRLAQ